MGVAVLLWSIVGLVIALLAFWRFHFLRLPKRNIPKGDVIVSPANGKVVSVLPLKDGRPDRVKLDKGLLGRISVLTKDTVKDGFLMSIMLTPFDVHYQRSPIDGKVKKIRYTEGAFRNAILDAASFKAIDNERNEIVIEGKDKKKVKVVQIAGVLARRISCSVKVGQSVKRGEVIGLIDLGSQVTLVIPKRELAVEVGDKVIDGETVIAR